MQQNTSILTTLSPSQTQARSTDQRLVSLKSPDGNVPVIELFASEMAPIFIAPVVLGMLPLMLLLDADNNLPATYSVCIVVVTVVTSLSFCCD